MPIPVKLDNFLYNFKIIRVQDSKRDRVDHICHAFLEVDTMHDDDDKGQRKSRQKRVNSL